MKALKYESKNPIFNGVIVTAIKFNGENIEEVNKALKVKLKTMPMIGKMVVRRDVHPIWSNTVGEVNQWKKETFFDNFTRKTIA